MQHFILFDIFKGPIEWSGKKKRQEIFFANHSDVKEVLKLINTNSTPLNQNSSNAPNSNIESIKKQHIKIIKNDEKFTKSIYGSRVCHQHHLQVPSISHHVNFLNGWHSIMTKRSKAAGKYWKNNWSTKRWWKIENNKIILSDKPHASILR